MVIIFFRLLYSKISKFMIIAAGAIEPFCRNQIVYAKFDLKLYEIASMYIFYA